MENIVSMLKQLVLGDLAAMVVTGKVTEVDQAERTCDVDPDDEGAPLVSVRLRSVVDDEQNGFTIWPAVGSTVTVLMLDDHTGLVVQYSEVEAYSIRNQKESLKAILSDFLDAVLNQVFTTNNGPTIQLVNAPEFTAIKERLDLLFLD
ncbi:hypothetical protein [Hymenobacter glacieicola]|uniref:Uncharacterized protein n=1 Tax=Hymenobacter glacieicola TaxID=1562124 RepID=A0ABQ1WJK2_9BACT|nr:hypothetical protein [Hymenobacter glacieicola]GGG33422.1 hypothetical protein GCM10011378_07380 [Hymenobacter glacieicola]